MIKNKRGTNKIVGGDKKKYLQLVCHYCFYKSLEIFLIYDLLIIFYY